MQGSLQQPPARERQRVRAESARTQGSAVEKEPVAESSCVHRNAETDQIDCGPQPNRTHLLGGDRYSALVGAFGPQPKLDSSPVQRRVSRCQRPEGGQPGGEPNRADPTGRPKSAGPGDGSEVEGEQLGQCLCGHVPANAATKETVSAFLRRKKCNWKLISVCFQSTERESDRDHQWTHIQVFVRVAAASVAQQ